MSDKVTPIRPRNPHDSYEKPELVYDQETGLFDVVFQGCVTHHHLDIFGEREAIREAARVRPGPVRMTRPTSTGEPRDDER